MARRRPVRRAPVRGRRGGGGTLTAALWAVALVAVLGAIGVGGWKVAALVAGREAVDEATLCPETGPSAVVAILLDLTDPLAPTQAARLRTLLDARVEAAPVHAMIAAGVVSEDPAQWGARFALCKPATGEDANPLYENPRLIAERFEEGFRQPFRRTVSDMMAAAPQDRSPIMEALQALLSETAGTTGSGAGLSVIVVSDLLQNSDILSFYRGEGWDALEATGAADRLAGTLEGAQVELIRIPRPEAPESARALADPFWARYLDQQGVADPPVVQTLGDL